MEGEGAVEGREVERGQRNSRGGGEKEPGRLLAPLVPMVQHSLGVRFLHFQMALNKTLALRKDVDPVQSVTTIGV